MNRFKRRSASEAKREGETICSRCWDEEPRPAFLISAAVANQPAFQMFRSELHLEGHIMPKHTEVVLMRLQRIQMVCRKLHSDILISETDALPRKVYLQVAKADDAILEIIKMLSD